MLEGQAASHEDLDRPHDSMIIFNFDTDLHDQSPDQKTSVSHNKHQKSISM